MSENEDHVTLLLTQDQALVLFDFLSRFGTDNPPELRIADQAEERVLWNMCCMLEKQLVQPFCEDYDLLLAKARAAVRDPEVDEHD